MPSRSSLPAGNASDDSTSMHLGKRSHSRLPTENRTSKRQKLGNNPSTIDVQSILSQQLPQRPSKVLPSLKADRPAGLAEASRSANAVQPLSNGTIIAPHSRLTNGESQTQSFASTSTIPLLENARKPELDKRTLRSQDGGSRSKSELAQYFSNFDEIVSNDPKEVELLTAETRLYITEDPPLSPSGSSTFVLPSPTLRRQSNSSFTHTSPKPIRSAPVPTPTTYQQLDFSHVVIPPQGPASTGFSRGKGGEAKAITNDPLPNSLYAKAHRRAERQEKQLRNIEKERAMHEKVQLERLLDGLQGPDWLKVMGISGIVEGERKRWDDRRFYFVREVKALLEKFRLWKEEERRRKVEKETSVRDEDESDEEVSDEEEEDNTDQASEDEDAVPDSPSDPAARQLLSESLSASTSTRRHSRHRKPSRRLKSPSTLKTPISPSSRLKRPTNALSSISSLPSAPKPPTFRQPPKSHFLPAHDPTAKPFVSFFSKPHQRAAALDPRRRVGGRGTGRLAFGVALPELEEEKEFALPQGFVSQAAMRVAARRSRLLKEEKMGPKKKAG